VSLGWVVSTGACGALGLNSLQLAMNARAGLAFARPSPFRDRRGGVVGLGMTGGLGEACHGYDRMLALAVRALREAVGSGGRPDLPLVVAVPERGRPDDDERFDGALVTELGRAAGVSLDLGHSAIVRAGHAGGALALDQARGLLAAGAPGVVVGGVDSYHHPEVVRWLDEGYRLHASGTQDGFIPGEGAAFCVLRSEPRAAAGSAAPLARLGHVGYGAEGSVTSGEPNLARTMTTMLRALTESSGPIEWAISDVNGERHRLREWSMLVFRELFAEAVVDQRMPSLIGDLGAATAASCLAYACVLWQVGAAPALRCAIALHSEGAERGVIGLEAAS
jgi:3-oxoacyl-[acyl-carrier-protein] synthase I